MAKEETLPVNEQKNIDDITDKVVESIILVMEGDERTAIIVGSIYVENIIRQILTKSLYITDEKKIFESNGGLLSTFNNKLVLAHALKIIDDKLYSILDKVRDLRNKCAHDLQLTFESGSHKDKLYHINSLMDKSNSYQLTIKATKTHYNSDSKCIIIAIFTDLITKLEVKLFKANSTK